MEENKEPVVPCMMYPNQAYQENSRLARENMHSERGLQNSGNNSKNVHASPASRNDSGGKGQLTVMETPVTPCGNDTARDLTGKIASPYFQDSGNLHQQHHHQQQQPHNFNTNVSNYRHPSDKNNEGNQPHVEHNEIRNFVCTECSRAFKRKDKLKRHTLIHTGEKSHVCGMCSKAFARRDKLTRHMRTHTNDKEYLCSLCPKAFYDNNGLSRHLKTHLGEKGFQCSTCSKSFYDHDNLLRHMKTHISRNSGESDDGISSFKCEYCGKLFKQDHYLKAHIMTYHGGSDPSAP